MKLIDILEDLFFHVAFLILIIHVPRLFFLLDGTPSLAVDQFRFAIYPSDGVSNRPESSADGALDVFGESTETGKQTDDSHDKVSAFIQQS